MSEYIHLIHRVSIGQHPDDFYFVGGVWNELNPGWNVVNWDDSCMEEFTDLRPIFDLYKRYPSLLETIVGIALVEKWGGVFVHHEVMPPIPLVEGLPDQAWMNYERTMFGACDPGDPFWHDFLSKLPTKYLKVLAGDESVIDLYLESAVADLKVVA